MGLQCSREVRITFCVGNLNGIGNRMQGCAGNRKSHSSQPELCVITPEDLDRFAARLNL